MAQYGLTGVFLMIWAAVKAKNPDGSQRFKYIILRGSSRSSKTWSLLETFYRLGEENDNWRLTAWRDTKTDCKKTVWEDWQKMLTISGRMDYTKRNKTESKYQIGTSSFEIHGTDDEETVHGLTQDCAWLNEPYKISKYTFDQIDQRSNQVFIDWNPKKSHWIEEVAKLPNAIVIDSTFLDNPFCPEPQKQKLLSYQPLPKEYKMLAQINKMEAYELIDKLEISEFEKDGLRNGWNNERNNTADDYMWSVYGKGEKAEKPNRIHSFKQIHVTDYHKIDVRPFYATDWGVVNPWAIIELKYYDGALYCHELNYKSESEIKKDLTPTELLQLGSSEKERLVTWVFSRLGIPKNRPVVCDNNRPMKITSLRDDGYDYAVAVRKYNGSVIDGINLLNNITVYYTSTSTNIQYEQENYERHTDKKTGEVLEEPIETDNHTMNAIRYGAQLLKEQGVLKA